MPYRGTKQTRDKGHMSLDTAQSCSNGGKPRREASMDRYALVEVAQNPAVVLFEDQAACLAFC